jgi:hypothetical protein
VQVPAWQVSACVHALPSLHAVPSAFAGLEQPVVGSHVPGRWHWSGTAQTTGAPPAHVPAWQVSTLVQVLPSSQLVPLAFAGFEHAPVAGLHTPGVWHWSGVGHMTGLAPVHAPLWQVSVCVQALPSLHAVPLARSGYVQVPVATLHVPGW